MSTSDEYSVSPSLTLGDDFMATLASRLNLIADRELKGDWMPKVRRGPPPTKVNQRFREDRMGPSDTPWKYEALCLRVDGDWFNIPSGGLARQRKEKLVELETCKACDVMEECRDLGAGQEFGIWGGLLPVERKRRHRESA